MPYSQIITLMIALSLVAGAPSNETAHISIIEFFVLWTGKNFLWWFFADLFIKKRSAGNPARLNALSERLQWAALVPLFIDLYLLDIKYFVYKIPGVESMPAIMDVAGLILFISYMAVVWSSQWSVTNRFHGISKAFSEELGFRLRMLLPILIPFVAVSFLIDILSKIPGVEDIFDTFYGRIGVIVLFLSVLIFLTPPMIRYIWRCVPLPEGHLRRRIVDFTAKEGLRFSDFLIWPLESSLCTAAVVGIIPAFRYIIITPCLIEHLSDEEIEAVLAHECAHVKKRHILWYILFLTVYSFVLFKVFEVAWAWLGSRMFFVKILIEIQDFPSLASMLAIIPVAGTMAIYFRFLMGYFMRNFERQADLAVFDIQPHPFHLIGALEKIAILAGNIREKPSWHHFSIAERVEFLQHAAVRRRLIKGQDVKLRKSMTAFIAAALIIGIIPYTLPVDKWHDTFKLNFTSLYLGQLAGNEDKKPQWYMAVGQLFAENGRYREAIASYEKALSLSPDNPDILNNYAWLLVTVPEKNLRDPAKAMDLAERAVEIKPGTGYILDTLALCLFMNGHKEKAIKTEEEAVAVDPENRELYLKQLKMFRSGELDGFE